MPRKVDGIEVVFMPRILDSIGEMLKLAGYFRELYCLRLEKWTELREEKSPEKWMELGRIQVPEGKERRKRKKEVIKTATEIADVIFIAIHC